VLTASRMLLDVKHVGGLLLLPVSPVSMPSCSALKQLGALRHWPLVQTPLMQSALTLQVEVTPHWAAHTLAPQSTSPSNGSEYFVGAGW